MVHVHHEAVSDDGGEEYAHGKQQLVHGGYGAAVRSRGDFREEHGDDHAAHAHAEACRRGKQSGCMNEPAEVKYY